MQGGNQENHLILTTEVLAREWQPPNNARMAGILMFGSASIWNLAAITFVIVDKTVQPSEAP